MRSPFREPGAPPDWPFELPQTHEPGAPPDWPFVLPQTHEPGAPTGLERLTPDA